MRAQTRRPVVGIIGNSHLINDRYLVHGAGQTNSQAIAEVAGCLPLIVPTDPALVMPALAMMRSGTDVALTSCWTPSEDARSTG